MMTSSVVIMPRSPWAASAVCTKKAGVPVEANVAAILRPIWPDLPSPVTMTRPFALRIRSTAWAKLAPSGPRRAAASALIPPLSVSSVRSADSTLSGMGPDDWVISGFELGMFWSREEGRSSVGACLARHGLRGDEGAPTLNRSLTIIVLTPLTIGPADRLGQSRKYLISLGFFHRGVVSRHEPEQTRAFPARGIAVLCADGPRKCPRGRPEPHPRPVQS